MILQNNNFLNHNANLDFDKIPLGRDRPTDRPTVFDFSHAQKSRFLFYLFKKRVIFGTKKSEKMTHEIERTGMMDIKISN
jgi:hypothetical protein